MARNAIESEFRKSKMADVSHFVKIFKQNQKVCINLKWPEMLSKVNFGHPKWPTHFVKNFQKKIKLRIDLKCKKNRKWISDIQNGRHQLFCQKFQNKIKVAYRSEMARNAIESEFPTSKMGAGGHFVKKNSKKFLIDLKWPEMRPKVIYGHPKLAGGSHFVHKFHKYKNCGIDLKW